MSRPSWTSDPSVGGSVLDEDEEEGEISTGPASPPFRGARSPDQGPNRHPQHARSQDQKDRVEYDGNLNKSLPYLTPANTSERGGLPGRKSESNAPLPAASAPNKTTAPTTEDYGKAIQVTSTGDFPRVGSTLGPYFCLGQLGKGTFSSIHKCINMDYRINERASSSGNGEIDSSPRLAAAKVELTDFVQSGVLDGEATLLDFLHKAIPGCVPRYMGHYKSQVTSSDPNSKSQTGESVKKTTVAEALVMEYLPGQDLAMLREGANRSSQNNNRVRRRVDLRDAIMITADIMLPLLQRMHSVGIVHRDVKPSNVVLRSSSNDSIPGDRQELPDFCIVDFGLSKSILVPEDSVYADKEHLWQPFEESKMLSSKRFKCPNPNSQHAWLKPSKYSGRACYRKQRAKADFRGTSMYASVHVHRLKDYCPRDDLCSLLYVFCDLVSGGLPWMSYAASRDRSACQRIKERVHFGKDRGANGSLPSNSVDQEDETGMLLMGDEYHVAKFKSDRQQEAAAAALAAGKPPPPPVELPQPLAMSKCPRRVMLLRRAFAHLHALEFWEQPDYRLIEQCIRNFDGNDRNSPTPVPRMDFTVPSSAPDTGRFNLLGASRNMPRAGVPDDSDPLSDEVFEDVDDDKSDGDDDLSVLPLELRFRLAQLNHHAAQPNQVPPRIALRDWMKVAMPLLYGEWDSQKFEGRHRTSTDGFKRDLYLRLLQQCRICAASFSDFQSRDYFPQRAGAPKRVVDTEYGTGGKERVEQPPFKRRKGNGAPLINISRAMFGLRHAIRLEKTKRSNVVKVNPLSFT